MDGTRGGIAVWCVAVLAPFVVLTVHIIVHRDWATTSPNDIGVTELAVRSAIGFERLHGPYSRFHFFHPGPLPFYALAPAYLLMASSPAGLYLGSVMINAIAAVGTVATSGAIAGRRGAAVATAAVWVVVLSSQRNIVYPWNPLFIVLPLTLTLVACAAAVTVNPRHTCTAVAAASFVAQSHIGPAPVVAVISGVSVVLVWRRWNRTALRPLGAAGAIGGVLWLPVVIQQVVGEPGNLSATMSKLGVGEDRLPPGPAMSLFARGVLQFPFGVGEWHDLVGRPTALEALGAIITFGAIALATAYGLMRRRVHLAALGGLALAGLCVTGVIQLGVRGQPNGYLVVWVAGLTIAGWIAAALAATDRVATGVAMRIPSFQRRRASTVMAVIGAIAVSAGAITESPDNAPGLFDPDAQSSLTIAAVQDYLNDEGIGPSDEAVRLSMHNSTWGQGAALLVALDTAGYDVEVDEEWVFMFGPEWGPKKRATTHLALTAPDEPSPAGAPGVTIAELPSVVIRRLSDEAVPSN